MTNKFCPIPMLVMLAALGLPGFSMAAVPDVVVSLKPIHSLVAGVMGSEGAPRLLVPGASSPHTYQMRFSDAKMLRDADLIVWVGRGLESFLHRPIRNLGAEAEVVTLHAVEGMQLLPNREGGALGTRRSWPRGCA